MAVAKLTYPVANTGDIVIAQLPPFVRYMTKHISLGLKALIMPLSIWNCCLISRRIVAVIIGMFFQEITSITEFLGSNFLLPTMGSKLDFRWHICYLLLLLNGESRIYQPIHKSIDTWCTYNPISQWIWLQLLMWEKYFSSVYLIYSIGIWHIWAFVEQT